MKRVIVAMSGGVDSSVTAWLLKNEGYDVIGVFLRSGVTHESVPKANPEKSRGCCSAVDASDARAVAAHLGIPFYSLDFAQEFGSLMDDFADSYLMGRTPNPCVKCNSNIKFGKLWEMTRQLNGDFLATGHYAQINNGTLHRAIDHRKDQTYVLFGIKRELLSSLLFPIGGYHKSEIRRMATEAGIITAQKPESMDLCFVPDGDAAGFVHHRRPGASKPGLITDVTGKELGTHGGIENFTIGQRKNLGINRSLNQGSRRFVLKLVPDENRVIVGSEEECKVTSILVKQCNWHRPLSESLPCEIKFSHQGIPQPGMLNIQESASAMASFDSPAFGVAPGQAVVFYHQNEVLGGGWIHDTVL